MKKLLSLVLALMMTLCCLSALAETEGYIAYEHPTLGYTLEYPESWFALDSSNIEELMNGVKDDEALAGLDLASIMPQITQTQMTMFLDVYGNNINLSGQELGASATAQALLTVMPTLCSQFRTMFADIVFLDEGSIYNVGDKEYCMISASYTLAGSELYMFQFYTCADTTLYIITLTVSADSFDMLDEIEMYTDHLLETLEF